MLKDEASGSDPDLHAEALCAIGIMSIDAIAILLWLIDNFACGACPKWLYEEKWIRNVKKKSAPCGSPKFFSRLRSSMDRASEMLL
jgi:hypothetical protein